MFECIGYVHIPDVTRKKLNDKSFKCVFLGVSEESKAFRMYDPESKKIVISRDMVFEEEEKWSWGKTSEEACCDDLEWGDEGKESEEEDNRANNSDPPTPIDVTNPVQGRRRREPVWMGDYVSGEGLSEEEDDVQQLAMEMQQLAMFASNDPTTFEETAKSSTWREAMDREIQAIERNGTWELTELPRGAKKIGVKWVFKTKLNEKGEVDKYKARLVAKDTHSKSVSTTLRYLLR